MFKMVDREDHGNLRRYCADEQKEKGRYGRGNMWIASREVLPSADDDHPLLSACENGAYDALGASGGGLPIVFDDRLCT